MDGILLVNKPKFITSNDLVIKVKKQLKEKVGHTGTLDFAASGLMILTIGKGTKFTQYFQKLDKEYLAEGKLGEITDTYDNQGRVVEKKEVSINEEDLINVIKSFEGQYYQYPPPFSAKRINGTRAYKLAKKGLDLLLKPILVNIYNIEIVEINLPYFKIKVGCSSGTYIRSLIKDIGDKLGCGAYMSDLVRLKIDKFDLKDAITLEDILKDEKVNIIDLKDALYFFDTIVINKELERKFKQGQKFYIDHENNGKIKVLNEENVLLGICQVEDKILKPEIVLVSNT